MDFTLFPCPVTLRTVCIVRDVLQQLLGFFHEMELFGLTRTSVFSLSATQ